MYDFVVIGGGAAGIFAAITAQSQEPHARVLVLEQSQALLSKVRRTGGGRCNLTNAHCIPSKLHEYYPRGAQELIGPMHTFGPEQTMTWFEQRSVSMTTEADGRVFPRSNSSESVVRCLLTEVERTGLSVALNQQIRSIVRGEQGFVLSLDDKRQISSTRLMLATGNSPDGYAWAASFGHTIVPPIPSLFALTIPTFPLSPLSGTAVDPVEAHLLDTRLRQRGSLLITHNGMSGPCILKLTSWAARILHERGYRATLSINWLPNLSAEEIQQRLLATKQTFPNRTLASEAMLPKHLWKALIALSDGLADKRMADISLRSIREFARLLHDDRYPIVGKSPHKEEFVTCGGVLLKEVNCKTMESKLCPGLYFGGEILDIDGVTGGFNLQNAWTTGYLAGR